MIAVIVGDHHRAQPAQIEPSLLSPGEEIALTNAAVDKHPLAVAAFSTIAAFPPLPLASMCSRSIKDFFHLNCH